MSSRMKSSGSKLRLVGFVVGLLLVSGTFIGSANPADWTCGDSPLQCTFNGRVGIGTTSPKTPLTVQTGTNSFGLTQTDGTVAVGTFVGADGAPSEGGWFGTITNHPLRFFTNNGPAWLTIDTAGRVTIGTPPGPDPTMLYVTSTAAGVRAGTFEISNSNGGRAALMGRTNGTGSGVAGISTNAKAPAGFFQNTAGGDGAVGQSAGAGKSGVYGFNSNPNGYGGFFRNTAGGIALGIDGGLRFGDGSVQKTAGFAPPPHVLIGTSVGGSGFVTLTDSSNVGIVQLTDVDGAPHHGGIAVSDGSNPPVQRAGMQVNAEGVSMVFADVKNFRVPNPKQPGTDIWYACVEGPEAAAYVRGTSRLVNGEAAITLPEHFLSVASPERMTVQVTPLSADSLGLAVVDRRPSSFVVKELRGGKGTYDFDWEAKAVRKGYENYRVVRPSMPPLSPRRESAGGNR